MRYDVEAEIARAIARAYPWLHKVERLPGAGLLLVFLPWEVERPAANDSGAGLTI